MTNNLFMNNIIYIDKKHKYFATSIISISGTIEDVILCLSRSRLHIAFVVDKNKKLVGTMTDGDVRRAILRGKTLKSNILDNFNKDIIYANSEINSEEILDLMKKYEIKQIPILNKNQLIIGVYFLKDLIQIPIYDNYIVIMAGGQGLRMRPLTLTKPKPMLTIKDKPIIQHIINNSKVFGFINFLISVNYKSSIIKSYFNKNKDPNIELKFIKEKKYLGTIGCLGLIKEKIKKPFVIINGDVISKINLSKLISFHNKEKSIATIVIKDFIMENPFGVVELNYNKVLNINEKPKYETKVLAGIYVFDSSVLKYIPKNKPFDTTTLILKLIKLNKKITAFPIHEEIHEFGKIIDIENYN